MELILFFFYFLLAVLIIGYLYIQRKHQYWKQLKVPYVAPEFFYGNSRGIDKVYPSGFFFRDMYLKHKSKGPIFGVYIYTEPFAILTDLDLIKAVMVKEFNTFPSRGGYHNEKDDPVSANLANVDGEKWKSLRSKLTPTFTSGKLKMMFSTICEVSDKFMEQIQVETKSTGQVEIKDILSRFTTDVIGKTAFGIECNSLENPQTDFYKYGLKAFGKTNFVKRLLTSKYPNLARKLHITSSDKEISNFYRDVIEQTINYREKNKVQRNDFINLLMNSWNTDSPMTFNEIWAQSVVFFLAGYETSSTALTYTLYELSQHSEIQQIARESARKVLEKFNGEFTYEAVSEMQYIEQCAKGKNVTASKFYL
jgi:cytochrome P450 family 6